MFWRKHIAAVIMAVAAAFFIAPVGASDAQAQDHAVSSAKKRAKGARSAQGSGPYFVEFRARKAASYGHTYLVHGRVGQRITKANVVGLHPATESVVPWLIGHLVPVPSETGASDGDAEEEYVSARYRVRLSEAQYRQALTYMRSKQMNSKSWHAIANNCNAFIGDIAMNMGLKAPSSSMSYPEVYINTMRELNRPTGADVSRPLVQWGQSAGPPVER